MAENKGQPKSPNIRREGLFEFLKGQLVSYLGHSSFVDIPVGTSILGKQCFKDNKFIEVVHIPKSVLSVRENCFENCTNLKKIIVDGKNINWAKGCFKGCNNFSEIVTTKQYAIDMGGLKVNGYITVNLKESNTSTTPNIIVNQTMKDVIFDLSSTFFKGDFENTIEERLEIFIDKSICQHQASLNVWQKISDDWNDLLRLQKIAYDKLVNRQKDTLIKQIKIGLDDAYDCLDNQAVEYKELIKSQKADRLSFLEQSKQEQITLNRNILGENYVTTSWGFEKDSFFEK